MSPHISAIVSDVDWKVAHDANAVTTTTVSNRLPLPKKLELHKPMKLQFRPQFVLPLLHDGRIPLPYSRIPMDPSRVIVDFLACHEERIVVQPLRVLLAKSIEGPTVGLCSVCKERVSSVAKEFLFEGDYSVVGHTLVRKIRSTGQVRGRQKSFLAKSSQIYEQGISGKCREALIGGIAVSGGVQRQDLPDFLP